MKPSEIDTLRNRMKSSITCITYLFGCDKLTLENLIKHCDIILECATSLLKAENET